MTADKEILKRLEYTSSEDEFLDYEDAKENCVHLNRRRSKMGKFSNRTPAKRSRSSKRRSYPESKVNGKGRDHRQTRSCAAASKATESDMLQETKKASKAIKPTAFITTKRLTTGITGIFGTSKVSDIVKRPGTRRVIDLSKRKVSLEVQEQVTRGLERILKEPSFTIQQSVVNNEETADNSNEKQSQSPSVCEKSPNCLQRCQSRMLPSVSSSVSSQSFHTERTPHTELSKEVPFEEISRRLKQSLALSDLFPGKNYFDELKEDLRKTLKQHISILKNEDLCSERKTPKGSRTEIVPISVSRKTRRIGTRAPLQGEAQRKRTKTPKISDVSMATSEKDTNTRPTDSNILSKAEAPKQDICEELNSYACATTQYSPAFNLAQCGSRHHFAEQVSQESRPRTQIDHQTSSFLRNQGQGKAKSNAEDERLHSDRICHDPMQFYHQQVTRQRYNQRQPPHQELEQQLQDSGTFSLESITRGQRNANNTIGPFDAKGSCIVGSHFHPRRQGTLQNDRAFLGMESNYNQYVDHDYATNSNQFDILHYAGEINGHGELDDFEGNSERTRAFSSYLTLPKKPCVDTPKSPFKLFRMKMF